MRSTARVDEPVSSAPKAPAFCREAPGRRVRSSSMRVGMATARATWTASDQTRGEARATASSERPEGARPSSRRGPPGTSSAQSPSPSPTVSAWLRARKVGQEMDFCRLRGASFAQTGSRYWASKSQSKAAAAMAMAPLASSVSGSSPGICWGTGRRWYAARALRSTLLRRHPGRLPLALLLLLLGCNGGDGRPPAAGVPGPAPGPAGAPCEADAGCPGAPCRAGVCRAGRCAVELARPGSVPQEGQQAGDCKRFICGVGGELLAREDPADVPAADGNPCTRELCSGATPGREAVAPGASCGAGVCSAAGACVGLEEIAVGRYHGCLRLGDGTVRCWGANERGQAGGEESAGMVEGMVTVAGLDATAALALGGSHSCALSSKGQVRCWGANQSGQLGDGSTSDRVAPSAVQGLGAATAVAAGLDTTCAVAGGAVFCWGQGSTGQLGNGKRASSPLPVRVALPGKGAEPVQVSVGGAHACALVTGGRVFCWGSNLHGQLGDGSTSERATPGAVALLDDARQIAAGRDHVCALRSDRTVWCWGWGKDGQLGLGDRDEQRKPARVPSLKGAIEVAAGNGHSCARTGEGIACWGWNSDNQVSKDAVGDALSPVEIGMTKKEKAVQLALGSKHSCARLASGSFTCWGRNDRGQLGGAE